MSKLVEVLNRDNKLAAVCDDMLATLSDGRFLSQKNWVQQQRHRLVNPEYLVTMLGTWNSGKSSVLNRILFNNEVVLPVGDRPTTRDITFIKKGDPKLQICRPPELPETIAEGENDICEKLADIEDEIGGDLDLEWDTDALNSGIAAVDTPGLEDPDTFRSKKTKSCVDNCQACIIVSTLQNVLTDDLKKFLKKKVFSRNKDKFFFLINKCDSYDPDDGEETPEEMAQYLAEQIAEISEIDEKECLNHIFCVSANTGEGFEDFERAFAEFLLSIKKDEVFTVIKGNLMQVVSEIERKIARRECYFECSREEIEEDLNKKKAALRCFTQTMRHHMDVSNDDFSRIRVKADQGFDSIISEIISKLEEIRSGKNWKDRFTNLILDSRKKKTNEALKNSDIEEKIDGLQRKIEHEVESSVERLSAAGKFELKNTGFKFDDLFEGSSSSGIGILLGTAGGGAAATAGLSASGMLLSYATASTLPAWLGGGTRTAAWLASNGIFGAPVVAGLSTVALVALPLSVLFSLGISTTCKAKATTKKIDALTEEINDSLNKTKDQILEQVAVAGKSARETLEKELDAAKENLEQQLKELKNQSEDCRLSNEDQDIKKQVLEWKNQLAR